MHLVVTHAFAGYARGDVIADASAIAAAFAEHPSHVVRVARPADDVAVASTAPLEPIPETAPETAKE